MKAYVLILSFTLAGCGSVVQATSPRNTIIQTHNMVEATRLAEQECGKYGRHARYSTRVNTGGLHGYDFVFDCVE